MHFTSGLIILGVQNRVFIVFNVGINPGGYEILEENLKAVLEVNIEKNCSEPSAGSTGEC